jgi:hypothetical protein
MRASAPPGFMTGAAFGPRARPRSRWRTERRCALGQIRQVSPVLQLGQKARQAPSQGLHPQLEFDHVQAAHAGLALAHVDLAPLQPLGKLLLVEPGLQPGLAQRDAAAPFFLGEWYGAMALGELNAVISLAKQCANGEPEDAAMDEMIQVALAVYLAETGQAHEPITPSPLIDMLSTMAMQGMIERFRRQGLVEVKRMSIRPDTRQQMTVTEKGRKLGPGAFRTAR